MSKAKDIYSLKRDEEIIQRMEEEKPWGVTGTVPHGWALFCYKHDNFFDGIRDAVYEYLLLYIQEDNLREMAIDYVANQEPYMRHTSEQKRMVEMVGKILLSITKKEPCELQTNAENGLYKYLEYILTPDHLYGVAIDYLMHCERYGGHQIFKEGMKEIIMDKVYKIIEQIGKQDNG